MGLLHGAVTSLAAILDEERAECVAYALQMSKVERTLNDTPSMTFVTRTNAAAKLDKAHGESCVGAEVNRCWPIEVAKLTHPLHVKSTMNISRPLKWRGGMLGELWKCQGVAGQHHQLSRCDYLRCQCKSVEHAQQSRCVADGQ